MPSNHLIVTADDFGLAVEVNEAVESAHRSGILSSTSLMVAGPAAADAVRRAHALPNLRVGLHVTLVDGRSILPPSQIPDLLNAVGELRQDMVRLSWAIATRRSVRRQVRAEIAAQFEAFGASGLALDHVNAHKHFHLHPVVASDLLRIGRQYGMKALRVPSEPQSLLGQAEHGRRMPELHLLQLWTRWLRRRTARAGVTTADAVFGLRWSGQMTAMRLVRLIDLAPPGVVEIYTHPAVRDDFHGHAPGYRYSAEWAALRDPECRRALDRSGYSLGGYSDVDRRSIGSP